METYKLINKNVKCMQCDIFNYSLVCKKLTDEGFKAHIITDDYKRFKCIEVSVDNTQAARHCYHNLYIFNYVIISEHIDLKTKKIVKFASVMPESQFNELFVKECDNEN